LSGGDGGRPSLLFFTIMGMKRYHPFTLLVKVSVKARRQYPKFANIRRSVNAYGLGRLLQIVLF